MISKNKWNYIVWKSMKSPPPMRKWVIVLLTFYFLCIMRIYGTPKEFTYIEFIQSIIAFWENIVIEIINENVIFLIFSFIILVIVFTGCIVNKDFRHFILESLIQMKKEITGEAYNEKWATAYKLVREQIYVCQELENYAEIIYKMCEKAGVYEVNFIKDDLNESESIISSFERNGQPPAIIVKAELLNRLEIIDPVNIRHKIFKFIIAHELVHVKYHDNINELWVWRFYSLLWFGGFVLLWNCFILSAKHKGIEIILAVLLLFWCIFVSVVISLSYWQQIKEFRADRLGLKISGVSPSVFGIYANYFPDGVFGKTGLLKRIQNYFKDFIYFFFPKKTLINEIGHPSNRKRKEELSSGRDWSVFEYFRYGYQMKKNILIGRGKRM